MAEQSIAILGAPTSGKTTFLAALSIALARRKREANEQGWYVVGADAASRRQLVAFTMALAHNHTFPAATPVGAIEKYHWRLVGPVWRNVPRRWLGAKRIRQTVQLGLDLADASGELSNPNQSSQARKALIDNLETSRGIIFLFDPVSEADRGDAFFYIFGVLAELAERMISKNEFTDGILPHYVAVCISKFDDVKVLTTAEKLDLIESDPEDDYGFPRVASDEAREFFFELCKVLRAGDPELVLNTIEQHFRRDRVRYFVTSAIGFYVNPNTNVYDPEDMQNLLEGTNPHDGKIRGNVHPINVVEPLMWLAGRLTGTETP